MRYHFHAVDNTISLNLQVKELPNYETALAQAEALATTLLHSDPEKYGEHPDKWEIKVTDADGKDVLSLPLSEVAGKIDYDE